MLGPCCPGSVAVARALTFLVVLCVCIADSVDSVDSGAARVPGDGVQRLEHHVDGSASEALYDAGYEQIPEG